MALVAGACHCGNLRIEAQLTRPAASYTPRACDCSFCRAHGAAYLSDPAGTLAITVGAAGLTRYRQGSAQADMLICPVCGVLVGALYTGAARAYGVVNLRVLQGPHVFGAAEPVSPARLGAAEKSARWQDIWFPNVLVRS
jgi:hypothetical protein